MVNSSDKKKSFERSIFVTGEYIDHFKPEQRQNPFSKIYKKKKQDTIAFILREKEKNTVLDIGGGMGRLALPLADSGKKEVILADISIDMLKLAVNRSGDNRKINVVNADAHVLPFNDNSVDILVGLDILCHLNNPKKALYEFYRVLKNAGVMIIDSTNSNPLWALFYPRYLGKNPVNWVRTIRFNGVLPGWENMVHHYSKSIFYSFVVEAGFEITKTMNYGPRLCAKWNLIVAQKPH